MCTHLHCVLLFVHMIHSYISLFFNAYYLSFHHTYLHLSSPSPFSIIAFAVHFLDAIVTYGSTILTDGADHLHGVQAGKSRYREPESEQR